MFRTFLARLLIPNKNLQLFGELIEAARLKRNAVLYPEETKFNGIGVEGDWIAVPRSDYDRLQEARKKLDDLI